MGKVFNLNSPVRNFYGEASYTIKEGIEQGKGKISVENNYTTKFKPKYYYTEGFISMRLNGNQAKEYLGKD